MDDSEKSYGYSDDIYHGQRAEKSYEYGAEGTGDAEGSELSPEEEAIRVEGPRNEENVPAPDTPEYDHGRESTYAAVESFTWDNPAGEPGREVPTSLTGEGEELPESREEVGASRGEPVTKPTR
ncbi:MAG TPA: hypothetical protein VGG03_25320 [Thermoanaerobaculia bacterium]|jgi:hypothetical protein